MTASESAPHDSAGKESAEVLRRAVVSVAGHAFAEGNRIDVLRNGDEIFPAMLDAIDAAQESVDLVTFVYWQGDIAQRFARALADKARAGIGVRVILDGFGSNPMDQALIDEMRQAGAAVKRFRPIVRWKLWENDHRTHRKILVCDNEVAFTGGVGIAEEWEGDARDPSEWRDTHFRIVGPVVDGLRAAFLTDWRDLDEPIAATDLVNAVEHGGGTSSAMTINGSAQIGLNDAERVLEAVFAVARKQIRIQTPYFNPTKRIHDLLIDALDREVEVDVMIPGPHIDKRVSDHVAKDRVFPLVKAGARIWEFQPTMLHTKSVIVDGVLSVVGSVNLNRRSVEKDEEVALAVLDEGVASVLAGHFDDDLSRCTLLGREQFPLWKRALGKILVPFRSEM